MKKLVHASNISHTQPQRDLARELSRRTFGGKVFLSNSGAEANECAIKLARRFGHNTGGRYEVIVFKNSFHGRTLATLTALATVAAVVARTAVAALATVTRDRGALAAVATLATLTALATVAAVVARTAVAALATVTDDGSA